jgi:FtsZ-interacting cell division protein ZipA
VSIWELAVRLVIIGGLSILAFAVVEAMWSARTKRRNAFRDARLRHPAGKALLHTPGHCALCADKGICTCPPCVREATTGQPQTGEAS